MAAGRDPGRRQEAAPRPAGGGAGPAASPAPALSAGRAEPRGLGAGPRSAELGAPRSESYTAALPPAGIQGGGQRAWGSREVPSW